MKFQFRQLQGSLAKPMYAIKNDAADGPTIYLYDAIGDYFGISAQSFVKDLAGVDAPVINLRINSPGGDVFAAQAMSQALRDHPAKVIAHIDGVAASAATTVALAADEVVMNAGGMFMIHNAWSLAMGDYREMTKVAGMLKRANDIIAADYQRKTGKTQEEINGLMDEETWFNAEEALASGFVDRIATSEKKAKNLWDLSGYSKVPENLLKVEEPEHNIEHLQRHLTMLERIA